jgi:DNA-binding IclR family transcriptional regulator
MLGKILAATENARVLTPAEIADASGLKVSNVQYLLGQMVKAGEAVKVGYGAYSVTPRVAPSESSDPSESN